MANTFDRLKTALADRYAIQEELGAGGMATVYLAEDLKHHRKVAVKVLRPELAAVLGAERFVKEIETTANLQHSHILPLFDSGEADSFLYYVMPFIDGETLRDKLNRETQLGIEEAVPPHGQVDVRKAAPALGLAPADLRMKTTYRVPEIWLADPDRGEVERGAVTLREAGLNVHVVSGDQLLDVPRQGAVISFAFTADQFEAALGVATATLAYDEQVFAVFHTPGLPSDARPSGVLGARTSAALGVLGTEGQPGDPAFFDIYRSGEGEVMRLWMVEDGVDFSGLGDRMIPSQAGNMRRFVAEWESRFQRATVDRRLVNLPLRQPMTSASKPALEQRKGFSFASWGLSELLDNIAPDLHDTGQADFSSRLVYLTTR